jgi:GDP-4-dehydro-6-deoxy-D-mannose reductase
MVGKSSGTLQPFAGPQAMRPTAFVTGAAGFCGGHLVAHLVESGYNVAGLDREGGASPHCTIYRGDIADSERVRAILDRERPNVIFHLAALTNPRLDYAELHHVNALGTISLLTAVRQVCSDVPVLITGTSAVYGKVSPDALPISEAQPFQPATPYAVSKIAQEMVAIQQGAEHGLRIIRTRAFNLSGPGESPSFVTSAFARQIAEIEAGKREPVLQVGNLETVRDLTDVRDAVCAYRLLAEVGKPGAVYNVCSGSGTPIRQLLEMLLAMSLVNGILVRLDPARLQPADVPIQVGDATRLREETGWVPTIPLRQTLQDVLDFWRQRISPGVKASGGVAAGTEEQ